MASQSVQYAGGYGHYTHGHSPIVNKPELPRSISMTNLETTSQCQDYVRRDLCSSTFPPGGTCFFMELPQFTFTIPHLAEYPAGFRQFVFDRIVDKTAKKSLEEERCLNWCQQASRLEPLHTNGDGNCLLHAASLGMWGFQDRAHILRNAVSLAVLHAGRKSNTLYERWQYNKQLECQQQGYQLEMAQWHREWETVVRQASPDPTPTASLHSLEEFHVFVLANVLRRPVIMYASQKMRSFHSGGTMQSINFHGVYLPLLWDPAGCKKDPLPLGYQNGHFSALVVVDFAQQYRDGKLVLPLVSCDGQPLPVRFMLQNEDSQSLLHDYISLVNVSHPGYSHRVIPCASLSVNTKPTYYDRLVTAFIEACHDAYLQQQSYTAGLSSGGSGATGYPGGTMVRRDGKYATSVAGSGETSYAMAGNQHVQAPNMSAIAAPNEQGGKIKCINNCGMYGDPETAGLCSKCHKKSLDAALQQEVPERQSHPVNSDAGLGSSASLTSSGAIKCSNCSQPGHPNFLGMCENCYRTSQQQPGPQPQYGNQPPQPQHVTQQAQYGNQPPQPHQFQQAQYGSTKPLYGNEQQLWNEGASQPQYGNQAAQDENPYESVEQYQKPPLPPRPETVSPPPVPLPRSTASDADRNKCRTPSCEFFGTAETRFYCSQCFERDMVSILKEVEEPTPAASVPNRPYQQPQAPHYTAQQSGMSPRGLGYDQQSQNEKCTWCHEYYGAQEYGGLCHGCFKNKTTKESSQKKCTVCYDFYGSEEYGGLCNHCFLKRTERETAGGGIMDRASTAPVPMSSSMSSGPDLPPPAFDLMNQQHPLPNLEQRAQWQQQPSAHHHHHVSEQNRLTYNQAGPQQTAPPAGSTPPQVQIPSTRPVPKPRNRTAVTTAAQLHAANVAHTFTAPIASPLTSQMAAMTISNSGPSLPMENCFLCTGSQPYGTKSYALCVQHAQLVTKQFPLLPTSQGNISTQHPSHQEAGSQFSAQPVHPPMSSQQYGHHSSPYPAGQPMYARPQATPTTSPSHYNNPSHLSDPGQYNSAMKHKPPPPVPTPTVTGNVRGASPAYNLHQEQHYPDVVSQPVVQPTTREANLQMRSTTSRANELATFNDLNTNTSGTGVPAHQEEMSTIGRGMHSGQDRGIVGGVMGGRGGIHGAAGGSAIEIQAGAGAGTTAAEPSGEVPRKEKVLCKTAGCSFYANPQLENLCSNCYEEYYEVKAPTEPKNTS